MTLETLNSIATIGTFVVIAVTAIAALVQLRHLRVSNQQEALLVLGAQLRGLAPMLSFVYHDLPKKMESPEFRREVGEIVDPQTHPELIIALAYDQMGALVRNGVMDEHLMLEFGGGAGAVVRAWDSLSGVIALRRERLPNGYQNFEFLASRAKRWLEDHPHGSYPPSEPRMPLPKP
jgi:hypothetical protein